MSKPRILFICKNRESSWSNKTSDEQSYSYSSSNKSSGLLNSVKFISDVLTANDVDCKIADVVDNNGIDKEVSLYKPTHVIIEALWVVPEKFEVLTRLHPGVKWIIRLHSEVPFIAGEGIAFDWIAQYSLCANVTIATNSKGIAEDLEAIFANEVLYLPNYYPISDAVPNRYPKSLIGSLIRKLAFCVFGKSESVDDVINIGCFGAIRPLKNQMIQAIAAIRFANDEGKKLRFHINGGRIEGKGEPIIRNIRELFRSQEYHELVEHHWMDHDEFIRVVKAMDICMQVSFSETYNIVAADAVAANVPVLVSSEIEFISRKHHANTTDTSDMVKKLKAIYHSDDGSIASSNYKSLSIDASRALSIWMRWIRSE
jgi:hypothetical protein